MCLLYIYFQTGAYNWIMILGFVSLLLPSLVIIILKPKIREGNNRLLKVIKNTVEGWNLIKEDPKYILIYGFFSIALLLLTTMMQVIIYEPLTGNVTFVSMLFLSTIGIIIPLLNFTPGGIGIKEGIYIFSADLVQIPDDILVLGSLVFHGITLIRAISLGGLSYLLLMKGINSFEE